jgi:hypothetical protein
MLKSQKLAMANVTSVVDFDHSIESFVTVMAHCFRNIGITQRTRVYYYYWIGSKGKRVKSNGFYATIAYRPIRQLINCLKVSRGNTIYSYSNILTIIIKTILTKS